MSELRQRDRLAARRTVLVQAIAERRAVAVEMARSVAGDLLLAERVVLLVKAIALPTDSPARAVPRQPPVYRPTLMGPLLRWGPLLLATWQVWQAHNSRTSACSRASKSVAGEATEPNFSG